MRHLTAINRFEDYYTYCVGGIGFFPIKEKGCALISGTTHSFTISVVKEVYVRLTVVIFLRSKIVCFLEEIY